MPLATLASRPVRRPKVVISPPVDNWTLRVDTAFDTTSPSGWGSASGGGSVSLVDDGVSQNYTEDMPGGVSPWTYEKGIIRSRGVRCVQKVWLSSDFDGHSTGVNKDYYFYGGIDPDQIPMAIAAFAGVGANPLRPRIATQGAIGIGAARNIVVGTETDAVPVEGNYNWDNESVEVTRNAFHTYDTRIVGNTSGNTDGYAELYLDDVLVVYVTGLEWREGGAVTWDLFQWAPIWGGSGGTVASQFEMRTGDGAGNGIKLYTMT